MPPCSRESRHVSRGALGKAQRGRVDVARQLPSYAAVRTGMFMLDTAPCRVENR